MSGGNFVSGVEEDLNVAQEVDPEELEKLMEEKFDQTLKRRDQEDESAPNTATTEGPAAGDK